MRVYLTTSTTPPSTVLSVTASSCATETTQKEIVRVALVYKRRRMFLCCLVIEYNYDAPLHALPFSIWESWSEYVFNTHYLNCYNAQILTIWHHRKKSACVDQKKQKKKSAFDTDWSVSETCFIFCTGKRLNLLKCFVANAKLQPYCNAWKHAPNDKIGKKTKIGAVGQTGANARVDLKIIIRQSVKFELRSVKDNGVLQGY